MDVRPATVDDASSIAPLLAELGYPTTVEEVRRRLARALGDASVGVQVAEVDGAPAALVAYALVQHLERPRPTCRITTLVTDPSQRRRGAAAALLAAVEAVARESGCERLEVTTRPQREDALAFYLDAGFEERPRRLVRALA
jgi:ribosomal protein S18 acetylase RimI-like enzyme